MAESTSTSQMEKGIEEANARIKALETKIHVNAAPVTQLSIDSENDLDAYLKKFPETEATVSAMHNLAKKWENNHGQLNARLKEHDACQKKVTAYLDEVEASVAGKHGGDVSAWTRHFQKMSAVFKKVKEVVAGQDSSLAKASTR